MQQQHSFGSYPSLASSVFTMRIRKNAKISTLFCTNTNLNSNNGDDESLLQKSLLCQLNQSPWDVITFPSADSSSSSHKFDDYEVCYDVNHAGNGIWVDSVGDFERKITLGDNVASVKTFEEDGNDDLVDPENDHKEVREEVVLCDVEDEEGWQCGRLVTNGVTVCDRHIKEMQNRAAWTTKKKPGSGEPVAETRARQAKKRVSTNPYEFYYYSGFGPSWGKKRGPVGSTFSNTYNEPAEVGSSNGYTTVREEEGGGFEPETSDVQPVVVEYDDDKKKGKTGKKRGRKPLKSRSLKSLM